MHPQGREKKRYEMHSRAGSTAEVIITVPLCNLFFQAECNGFMLGFFLFLISNGCLIVLVIFQLSSFTVLLPSSKRKSFCSGNNDTTCI